MKKIDHQHLVHLEEIYETSKVQQGDHFCCPLKQNGGLKSPQVEWRVKIIIICADCIALFV